MLRNRDRDLPPYSKDEACPNCHLYSDRYKEYGICLCGYNLGMNKVDTNNNKRVDIDSIDLKRENNEDIYDMLCKVMHFDRRRKVRTQIKTMADIYDFFIKNPDFDWTIHDIRKSMNFQPSRYAVEIAVYRLQQLGFVKNWREIGNKTTWQLTNWKNKDNDSKT